MTTMSKQNQPLFIQALIPTLVGFLQGIIPVLGLLFVGMSQIEQNNGTSKRSRAEHDYFITAAIITMLTSNTLAWVYLKEIIIFFQTL